MTFKRMLMPVLMLGIIFTMGSMAYAQVTCGISPTGPAIPAANVNGAGGAGTSAAVNLLTGAAAGIALVGPSANNTATGHTEPVAAGAFEVPLDTTPAASNNGQGTNANPPRIPGGGTIRVTCVNGGTAQTPGVVVLTLSFGVPITNTTSFPSAAAGIRLLDGTGIFITPGQSTAASNTPQNGTANATCVGAPATAGCANVGISSINNSAGQIVIGLGTPAAFSALAPQNPSLGITFAPGAVGTFDVSGVLVSTNGLKTPVIATLSSSAGLGVGATAATTNSAASTATAVVTTAVTPGLADPTVATGTLPAAVTGTAFCGAACSSGAAVLTANGTPANGKNNFTIRIQENYPEMFKSALQFNGGGVFPAGTASSTQVNIVLNAVPTGLAISNCTAALTDTTGATNKTAFGTPLVTPNNAVSNTLNVIFQNDLDLTAVDVLWVTCQVGIGSATLPLPAASVTAQVELAPVGTALSSTGGALTSLITGNVPRYQAVLQPATALPVVTFPPTTTTLLIPFTVVVPGINTGIAVANTSTDIFGASNGGATPTNGTIVFTLFKNDGTQKTFTTGTINSGTVYAANLSDIISSAGAGTAFTGYIFAVANFPNAHGSATIYDTSTGHAELSTPVLVVQSGGNNITTANPRLSPESLGQ